MRILESERLLIKPVEEEDIYQLLEFRWEKDTMCHLLHEPISKRQQLEWYRSLSEKDLALSVFLKETEPPTLVGFTGFFDIDTRHQRARMSNRLTSAARGRGLGYECARMVMDYGFNTMNLRKIYSDQFAENLPSVKHLRRLGWVEEGVLRKHYYQNGKFRDVSFVAVLKEDFLRAIEEEDKKAR